MSINHTYNVDKYNIFMSSLDIIKRFAGNLNYYYMFTNTYRF